LVESAKIKGDGETRGTKMAMAVMREGQASWWWSMNKLKAY